MNLITGTVTDADGSPWTGAVDFAWLGGPGVVDGKLVRAKKISAQCDAAGAFSIELVPGDYKFSLAGVKPLTISIPDDGEPHDLAELLADQTVQPGTALAGRNFRFHQVGDDLVLQFKDAGTGEWHELISATTDGVEAPTFADEE